MVLDKGMVVISLAKIVRNRYSNLHYFKNINDLIIEDLISLGVDNLSQKGTSDICIGNRKILGSSLYRTAYNGREILFYQASLLVNPNLTLIERYIKHPPREPAYRNGRKHQDFLTSLEKKGHNLTVNKIINCLEEQLNENLWKIS